MLDGHLQLLELRQCRYNPAPDADCVLWTKLHSTGAE